MILGHVINDMSTNSLSGLLPVLTAVHGLSYILASVMVMVFNITSSLLQPLFGRWFDRSPVATLLETGVAANCICMGLVGIAPNYGILLPLVALAGLGSAAFHPPAFSAVAKGSETARGRGMAFFLSAGNTGFFLGPIFAGVVISALGLPGTLLLVPAGMTAATLLHRVRPESTDKPDRTTEQNQPARRGLLAHLATITALRSIAVQSAVAFLPIYFVVRGESLLAATAITSSWLAVGVLGQLTGGILSDRVGRRPIVAISLTLGSIVFYGFLTTTGPLSIFLLLISGGLLFASWSVIMAMSSEAAPSSVGTVTGFMLGFSVGIGGLGALLFGGLADSMGLPAAFDLVIAFAFVGGIAGLLLPKHA